MATAFSGDLRRSARFSDEEATRAEPAVIPVPAPVPDGLRYVARQPILDVRGNVHGYELLFRSGPAAVGFQGDGDAATRMVLDNTVIFGLERLTGGLPVFVNCTQEALLDRLVMVLPPAQTVLEVLETLEPTAALLEACLELKVRGFRVALDDFEWKPAWKAFVELADYIKVDLSKTTREQRAELIAHVRGSSGARLVAERVETQADLTQVKSEGFTLFQGYYFCRPVLMQNRDIPKNRLVHLELLQALQDDPLNTARISNLVKREASLTYRLLRMVNSPLYGTSKVVSSIHGALVMIGDEMFRRIAMLAIASELKGNQPMELLRMAFLRGRFCELAAQLVRQDATEQYLLGILSLLPAMLGVAMEIVADALPLRAEVREALLGNRNRERTILQWLESYEVGHWAHCDEIAHSAGFTETAIAKLPKLYSQALLWAETTVSLATE